MRRIVLIGTVALVLALIMISAAMPAFAQGLGPSECSRLQGYQGRVFIAGDAGAYSGAFNPGNSNNPANDLGFLNPLVPYAFNCNPPFGD